MKLLVLVFLLLASFAVAQGNKPSPNSAVSSKSASNLAVITIKGTCNSSGTGSKYGAEKTTAHKGGAAACKTVVTRTEFEQLADAMNVSPAARRPFASWYATTLISSNKARERGLDRGQRYQEILRITRMQVLAQLLERSLKEEADKVPEQDIENYYQHSLAMYQEATLERLYIPRTQQQDPSTEAPKEAAVAVEKQVADSEMVMKKEADDLRARAAAGEDFAQLQAEAYKLANVTGWISDVKMVKVRRTALPDSQAAVFDMKPGTVSQLFTDSEKSYVLYKLDEEETFPLSGVHDEIRATLRIQRMQDATQRVKHSATPTFDEAYFASTAPSSPSHPAGETQGTGGSTPPSEAK